MKLPLHPKDSWEIIDEDGKYICLAVNTPDRDYIIKVVNSHEKLVKAFGLARSMLLGGEDMTPKAEEIFEQALKEVEKL